MNIKNCPKVYKPSDDTFLMLKNIKIRNGENVLDMGTGSGIIGIHSAKLGANVTCADINPYAVELAEENAGLNNVDIKVVESDLFERIKGKFDVIVFNPPYLPTSNDERIDDEINFAWDGGKEGSQVIVGFLRNFKRYLKKDGRCYLLVSSLNKKALKRIEELDGKLIGEKKLFFESLRVFQL
ncbi:MAG: methyltransferase [Candidatus Thermoplasmatota archaeon]|nr:methyltransferase [Candidatus Thermoplasmatota archaeon]